MTPLSKRLDRFWFPNLGPERLALIRIVTGLFALWYLTTRYDMMLRMVQGAAENFEPVGIAILLESPVDSLLFKGALLLTIFCGAAYTLGWKFRYTGPAFAVLFFAVMCYRNSWSMIYHNYNALVLQVGVVGFTAASGAISLDSILRGRSPAGWRFGWPVMLISAVTLVTYFLSGYAKVEGELAWSWASGEAMRSQVAVDALRKEILAGGSSELFRWLYGQTWLFLIAGLGTLVIELGAIFVLLNRKVAMVWAALTVGMHWGIWFLMEIHFPFHMSGLIFLSLFPAERAWFWLKRQFLPLSTEEELAMVRSPIVKEPAVVLFDGVCNFCNATVRFIIDRDPAAAFRFASLQSDEGQALLVAHDAPSDLSTIVLIENNQLHLRSSAVLRVARRLRFPYSLASVFLLLPRFLRDGAYRLVARHRYAWFGRKEVCELPGPGVAARFLG